MRPAGADFLSGGGEMGRLIGAFDWATTPLGPLSEWPQSLRTAVSLMLGSQHPMWIGWGPDISFLYNDAYVSVLSLAKHPWALGRPTREVWIEIWDSVGALVEDVFRKGEASFIEEAQLFMRRGDFLEETYYSFSYSPIRDESGAVGGLFCPSAEITAKVLGARRLATLSELAAKALLEKTVETACASAFATIEKNPADFPFALLFLPAENGAAMQAARAVRITDSSFAERAVAEVAQTGQALTIRLPDSAKRPPGLAGLLVSEAIVLPVSSRGDSHPLGVLVAGINPTRRLDTDYRTFFELVSGQIATAMQNASAVEEEKRRAEALAELDRAKTTFFSNISHELRTPLTLMLGPIEDMVRKPEHEVLPENRALAELARRNGQRLLKLVNTLLDFSRLEAGRMQANFQAIDLAAFTADLAGVFRSAIEKAGVTYTVVCEPLPESIHVDREMWEKIVLNLLSNAFKFTFTGEIRLELRWLGDGAELIVTDTGVGIPPEHLPRIFERFHRVPETRGRSHEGTGIGLALVQELARLHGGGAHVESELGRGTTFFITIAAGTTHLSTSRAATESPLASTAPRAYAFLDEAASWMLDAVADSPSLPEALASRGHILLADDNADMRAYVRHLLLSEGYEVTAVPDGEAALMAARATRPSLVLSDVMMPRLDGFGLLRALREDPALRTLPIILLSARAGEEARVEGLERGADEYLAKPFTARELLARVRSHLELVQARNDAEAAITAAHALNSDVLNSMSAHIAVLDENGVITLVNRAWEEFARQNGADWPLEGVGLGTNYLQTCRQAHEAGAGDAGPIYEGLRAVINGEIDQFSLEYPCHSPTAERWFLLTATPFTGERCGAVVSHSNITERRRAEDALRESEERFRTIANDAPMFIFMADTEANVTYINRAFLDFLGLRDMSEFTGAGWKTLLHPDDHEATFSAYESGIREQCPYSVECRYREAASGEYRWILFKGRPQFIGGQFSGVMGTGVLIHDRRIIEENLRLAKEQAESASRAKDDFLAQLSHELRTPLTPVLMTASALREDEDLADDVREQLAMIERNVALEARLIDDLLDLTRITRGKLSLRAEPCDLHALLAFAADIVRDDTREKQISLTLNLAAERSHLIGDPARLQQVFWNLLRNAVKFTPDGGRIGIHSDDLFSEEEGHRIRIQVSDDGIGFEPQEAARLFEPFHQAPNNQGAGLGLGLAIARAVVDLHCGQIRAASAGPGRGATFTVELPRTIPKTPDLVAVPTLGSDEIQPEPSMHLLVVEDHDATLQVLSRLLTRAGHRIVTASSVATALSVARDHRFDLVVSDLGLPDGTGLELMQNLRDRHGLRGIALSGYGMDEDLRRSEEAGFVAHLVKPVDVNELRRVLRHHAPARKKH